MRGVSLSGLSITKQTSNGYGFAFANYSLLGSGIIAQEALKRVMPIRAKASVSLTMLVSIIGFMIASFLLRLTS